jgi:hypothetical protein
MRAHHAWKATAIVIALVCGVAGCSVLPGGSAKNKKDEETALGTTYAQALAAMRPDTVSALKATMPNAELNEESSTTDCGGLDALDGKDGSKRTGSANIIATGAPSDKRQSKELVEQVAERLTGQGWAVEDRSSTVPAGHPNGYEQHLTKSGLHGTITVSAWPFKLTSGKTIQSLGASMVTDCLRNPDWRKG